MTRNESDTAAAGADAARWSDYLWVWCLFTGFIALLTFVVYNVCQAPGDDQVPAIGQILKLTLGFFAALMVGGFTVALLFDAAYDFFADRAGRADGERPKA